MKIKQKGEKGNKTTKTNITTEIDTTTNNTNNTMKSESSAHDNKVNELINKYSRNKNNGNISYSPLISPLSDIDSHSSMTDTKSSNHPIIKSFSFNSITNEPILTESSINKLHKINSSTNININTKSNTNTSTNINTTNSNTNTKVSVTITPSNSMLSLPLPSPTSRLSTGVDQGRLSTGVDQGRLSTGSDQGSHGSSFYMRSSKLKHMYGVQPKIESTFHNLRVSNISGDQNFIRCNHLYFAIGIEVILYYIYIC